MPVQKGNFQGSKYDINSHKKDNILGCLFRLVADHNKHVRTIRQQFNDQGEKIQLNKKFRALLSRFPQETIQPGRTNKKQYECLIKKIRFGLNPKKCNRNNGCSGNDECEKKLYQGLWLIHRAVDLVEHASKTDQPEKQHEGWKFQGKKFIGFISQPSENRDDSQ